MMSTIDNLPDKYEILMDGVWFILNLLIGIILTIYSGKAYVFVGMVALGFCGLSIRYYLEYIRRPNRVTIQEDGLVLHYRHSSDRKIRWDEILDIYSKPGPKETKWGRNIGRGAIRLVRRKKIIVLNYEIVKEVDNQYLRSTGRSPASWNGSSE